MGTWPEPFPNADELRLPQLEADDRADEVADEANRRARLCLEHGREAAEALLRVMDDPLLRVMLRASFRPITDLDVVPVTPCPYCLDGALRVAGTVRARGGRQIVRACDTCGAVQIGERRIDPGAHRHRPSVS